MRMLGGENVTFETRQALVAYQRSFKLDHVLVDPSLVIRCQPKMQKKFEQGYAIKFCVRPGKSGTEETLGMIRQLVNDEKMS